MLDKTGELKRVELVLRLCERASLCVPLAALLPSDVELLQLLPMNNSPLLRFRFRFVFLLRSFPQSRELRRSRCRPDEWKRWPTVLRNLEINASTLSLR